MNNLKYILHTFLIVLIISSCENENNENVGKGESINNFKLVSPVNFDDVTLNPGTPDKSIEVVWEAAKTGLHSEPTYRFLLDESGGDFSTPLLSADAAQDGKDSKVTLTNKQLIEALKNSSSNEFIWTVEAKTTHGLGENVVRATNPFSITISISPVAISDFGYVVPDQNKKILLDKIRTPNEKVIFSWTAATSAQTNVKYKWTAAATPKGFDTPLLEFDSDNGGTSTTLSFTHKQWIEILDNIAYTDGLHWQVKAIANDYEYVPETRFVWFEIFNIPHLYIVGSLTNNWSNTCTDAIELTNKSDGIFESLISIPANAEFKFVLACGSWEVTWGSPNDGTTTPATDYLLSSPGSNIKIQNAGSYFVRANFVTGNFTITPFTPPTALYLVGGATSAGWNPASSLPFAKTSEGKFETYAYLNADGFKFLQVKDWPGDWGKGEEGKLVQEGESNVTVSTSGFYRITADFITMNYNVQLVNWGIVGSSRTGNDSGWGADDDMTFVGGPSGYKWSITKTLFTGALKFRANDGWDLNFGDNGANGSLDYGGNDISITAGNYVIEITLDPVAGYSYTITPN